MQKFYKIEYSKNALETWKSLETATPKTKEGYDSLYQFSKDTSRYHFDENFDDTKLLGTNMSPVIPIKRFDGDWADEVAKLCKESKPATFGFRKETRTGTTNSLEENDFRSWGYDIDGGYTIANRIRKPELPAILQNIVDSFGFESPYNVKFDVQMPGQCFYWHIDNFGGVLKSQRGEYDTFSPADIDQRKIMRCVIFLDDQRQGQQWQQGNLLLNWEKGDCITWPWKDIPHGTCNYGHIPRPVLNLTGIVTEQTEKLLNGSS